MNTALVPYSHIISNTLDPYASWAPAPVLWRSPTELSMGAKPRMDIYPTSSPVHSEPKVGLVGPNGEDLKEPDSRVIFHQEYEEANGRYYKVFGTRVLYDSVGNVTNGEDVLSKDNHRQACMNKKEQLLCVEYLDEASPW